MAYEPEYEIAGSIVRMPGTDLGDVQGAPSKGAAFRPLSMRLTRRRPPTPLARFGTNFGKGACLNQALPGWARPEQRRFALVTDLIECLEEFCPHRWVKILGSLDLD